MSNAGGYNMPIAISWERYSVATGQWRPGTSYRLHELPVERLKKLREMLLRLNCRLTIGNHAIFIHGKLSVGVRAKLTSSCTIFPLSPSRRGGQGVRSP